jgi:alkanesulfonate monooxygenase SsuD/methylene tetrahydromethanopterin reductase-like flavin-dependent oxidoreductase (luciferase family)
MKIGIGLPNQVRNTDPAVIRPWAIGAERAGFSSLATIGRIAYPGLQDTVVLAAAAGATSTIGLFSNVLLGTVWPPVLLAKELASIDRISGGRLTVGLELGGRADDFVVDGRGPMGLGKRMSNDLEVYRQVWGSEPVGGGGIAAVPEGTRQLPLMIGGLTEATFRQMAEAGDGYIGAWLPPELIAPIFDGARAVWAEAGRKGRPRITALVYYVLGETDRGRGNIRHFYSSMGSEVADAVAGKIFTSAEEVRSAVKAFDAIGVDEVIFHPAIGELDQLANLAEVVF